MNSFSLYAVSEQLDKCNVNWSILDHSGTSNACVLIPFF